MNDIALITNTNISASDIWPMFYGQVKKHFPQIKNKYVFTDTTNNSIPEDVTTLLYNPQDTFRKQFLECLVRVKEKYVIYTNEDYILYDNVMWDNILQFKDLLSNQTRIKYVKFIKGHDPTRIEQLPNLFTISSKGPYSYTQQAALWDKSVLEEIHRMGPDLYIGEKGNIYGHFESNAEKTVSDLDINGVYCYYGEKQRGTSHHDSKVFPIINSAIIKGKWNISEYQNELMPLFKEYGVNIYARGIF